MCVDTHTPDTQLIHNWYTTDTADYAWDWFWLCLSLIWSLLLVLASLNAQYSLANLLLSTKVGFVFIRSSRFAFFVACLQPRAAQHWCQLPTLSACRLGQLWRLANCCRLVRTAANGSRSGQQVSIVIPSSLHPLSFGRFFFFFCFFFSGRQ